MTSQRTIRCVFPPAILQEPVLYNLGRDFQLDSINIRGAEIGDDHGWMDLEIKGAEEEIARVVAYLEDRGVEIRNSSEAG